MHLDNLVVGSFDTKYILSILFTFSEMAEWPPLTAEEQIYYDILFFSQGPSDGLLLGKRSLMYP